MPQKYDARWCQHCAKRLKGGTLTWETMICTECFNTLPEYLEARRMRRREAASRYYKNNTERARRRQREYYQREKTG